MAQKFLRRLMRFVLVIIMKKKKYLFHI